MKNLTYSLFALLMASLIILGCSKINDPASNGKIVASKTEVKINEPDSLVLVGAAVTDSIHWSIVPSGFNIVTTQKNAARVIFTKAGNYTVTATKLGSVPASIQIKVGTDSVSNPADTVKNVPLTGDQITLYPGLYKSAASDSSFIYFTAHTTNMYCATNGSILYNYNIDVNDHFSINFLGVRERTTCNGALGALSSLQFSFPENKTHPYTTGGSFPLKVTLNGTTYTGTIDITASKVTFNWNYTSGVIIANKVINR
jgi:hypothetical protein